MGMGLFGDDSDGDNLPIRKKVSLFFSFSLSFSLSLFLFFSLSLLFFFQYLLELLGPRQTLL